MSSIVRSSRSGGLALVATLGLLAACASEESAAMDAPPAPPGTGATPHAFEVTIENVSGNASSSTALSPGVYALHGADVSLFAAGMPDRGEGLARIAEDGSPAALASALAGRGLASTGVFDVPVGADAMGPATPGGRYVFTVEASAASPNLSFATMYGQSNDWFFSPDASGIPLVDADGRPLPERDVSDLVYVWDVGTEASQAPGMGPDQAPRQRAADVGAAEGTLAPFTDGTRGLPGAGAIARVDVASGADGAFTITVRNVSGAGSVVGSGISPVFYAVHDSSWALFTDDAPASSGLERLAEDGDAAALAEEHRSAAGTSTVGAATVADGASAAGGASPGGSFTFRVQPDATHRFLSIASMVGESNDAFLGFGRRGVALLDDAGRPRTAEAIADDMARELVVWDAGTEANEVPGAGGTQGPRQPAPGTGPADPVAGVRRYADATNDLATAAGGVVTVSVAAGSDAAHVAITVTNTSASTPFPGRASPLVWAVHTGSHPFFTAGMRSPEAIERLAEDGNPLAWNEALVGLEDVAGHGIVDAPVGTSSRGPIEAGASYTFEIPVGGNARWFDFAQMWTPSNDTFLSLGPKGAALVDDAGVPRAPAAIEADVRMLLSAWDAGTEANQAAALGPDQAPRQSAQNTGADEGGGLVRRVDGAWGVPAARHLVRVHVRPL